MNDVTVELASIRVAFDGDVKHAQTTLRRIEHISCEQDRARACAEGGFSANEFGQLEEPLFAEQFEESRGFSARYDERRNPIQLLGLADQQNISAKFFESPLMRVEVALQR